MSQTDPGKDRWQLSSRTQCCPALNSCGRGLEPISEDVTFVRYESDAVFVNVYHGRGSFEIGVEIGRLDRTEKYGLDYVVSLAKLAWEEEGFGRGTMFQVSTREGVQNMVPKVAELVKKYGDAFLRGNPAFYDELQKANERSSVEYEREQMLSRIRKQRMRLGRRRTSHVLRDCCNRYAPT